MAELDAGALQLLRGQLTMVPVANPLARRLLRREGERNLNRLFRPTAPGSEPADYEARITDLLCPLLDAHEVLLDLHSFQSAGEAFAMIGPRDNTGTLEPFARAFEEGQLALHLGTPRVVEGWLDIYAAGLAQRAGGAAGRRGGAGLRLGHQRIHAQPRRLRRHARMRPARGPGRARGGATARSCRRCACWA